MRTCAFQHLGFLCLIAAAILPQAAIGGTRAITYQSAELEVGGERHSVTLPQGYRIKLLVNGLGKPRLLTFAPNGDLFIGSRSGHVYRLRPPYRSAETLVRLAGYPHSVAFRPGEILIARTSGLYRAPYRPGQERIAAGDLALLAALPGGGGHDSRRQPKLLAVRFANGTATRVDDLVSGFQLADGSRWARPVGVALGPDGALYFTSDAGANALFRLSPVTPPPRDLPVSGQKK